MPENSRLHGLYLITRHDTQTTSQLLYDVRQSLLAGARIIQYRDKSSDAGKRQQQAVALKQLCTEHQAMLIINDDVELARQSQADGLHLGKQDTDLEAARQIVGSDTIIGVSCYNQLQLAQAAQQQGADYVAFGRFFTSKSKPDAVQADSQLLLQARQILQLPIVAIGGITPDNAPSLIEAGADMLAVINAVYGQPDISAATRRFLSLFNQ